MSQSFISFPTCGLLDGFGLFVVVSSLRSGDFISMSAGTLSAVCECNPLLGQIGFETLIGAIGGKTYPKWVVQADGLYEASQAAKMLPDRKY